MKRKKNPRLSAKKPSAYKITHKIAREIYIIDKIVFF